MAKNGQPYLSMIGQVALEHIKAGYLQARAMDARANAPTAPFGSREFATQVADQLHKQYPDIFPAGRA